MKAKIDLEKFISSMLGYAEDNCEETMLDYLHSALQDQGLEYKDGEIVEIAQESKDDRIRKEIIQYIKDTNKSGYLYDEEWIVWLEKREDKPTIRERYENIGKSEWFKKTHKDISIGEEQPTEEEMVGMGELAKAWFEKELLDHIDDVARRLHPLYSLLGRFITDYNKKTDKIIELLQSAILPIPRETYVPPIIKNPLDPDPNTLGGWETTASTEGGEE